jgi:hypothetical protein
LEQVGNLPFLNEPKLQVLMRVHMFHESGSQDRKPNKAIQSVLVRGLQKNLFKAQLSYFQLFQRVLNRKLVDRFKINFSAREELGLKANLATFITEPYRLKMR